MGGTPKLALGVLIDKTSCRAYLPVRAENAEHEDVISPGL